MCVCVCACVRACLFSNNNHDAAAAANADAVAGRKTCLGFHAFLYRNEFLWVAVQTRRILLINIALLCLFTAEFACCLLTHSLTLHLFMLTRSGDGDSPVIANRLPALAMCAVVVAAVAYFIFSIGCALIAI